MRMAQARAASAPPPPDILIAAPASVQESLAHAAPILTFGVNRTELEPDDSARLTAVAAAIEEIHHNWPQVIVLVEGHCDDTGTAEYNYELGLRRGRSVQRLLMGLGVPSAQLRVVSFGDAKPACTTRDASCRQQNRRIEFRAALPAAMTGDVQ